MRTLALLLLVSLATARTQDDCQTALTNLEGLFQILPDSALAFTSVFRTLCLQYEVDGVGVSFPIWIDGYKSHMAVNALLSSVQSGFSMVLNLQVVPPTGRLLAQVNATCTAAERAQGAQSYQEQLSEFEETVVREQAAFVQQFSFYTNDTFAGDAFVTSTQLLAYGASTLQQIKLQ